MASKWISWLVTEKGKRFTLGVVCATSVGICGLCTLPHTIFLDKYKEIVHLYKLGVPQKLSQRFLDRFDEAVQLLNISERDKSLVKPFHVCGFDVFHAGTLFSKYGGIVGIPVNFTYNSIDDADKSKITIDNEPVNWSTQEGIQLLESLILSDKAQIFAIAREVVTLSSYKLFLDTLYASSIFIVMYGMGHNVNRKFNLYSRPLSLRLSLYGLITMFGYGLYIFLKDFTQNHFDMKIDKELCEKHPVFVEGGKEFYEKIVQRNIALRKLMGSYGERKYSSLGNENFLIRQKRLPVVVRRDYFAEKYQSTL